MLAAELRQRISSGHHAVDSRTRPAAMGGELVPDKTLQDLEGVEPEGIPRLSSKTGSARARSGAPSARPSTWRARRRIEPYPENDGLKGILRRFVQIAKRHRDINFIDETDPRAAFHHHHHAGVPRYEYCVTNFEYDDELKSRLRRDPQNAGHDAGRRHERPPDLVSVE